ncbi:hypothetical protein LIER_42384 [Lithospermum erythrorhizon]|uniref:Uncharacterized protein n=1 Tax=Lithospermum erythrorhizon TaxID=34254 RepID=A0AAV3RQQ3_LITER
MFEAQEYEEDEKEESMAIGTTSSTPIEWRQPLINYHQHGRLSKDLERKIDIRRRAPRFLYYNDTLFRRFFGAVLLRCLSDAEAAQAMSEAHSGVCGAHQSGAKLYFQIKRMGYYMHNLASHAYNKKVCQRSYQAGDMVLAIRRPIHTFRKNPKMRYWT